MFDALETIKPVTFVTFGVALLAALGQFGVASEIGVAPIIEGRPPRGYRGPDNDEITQVHYLILMLTFSFIGWGFVLLPVMRQQHVFTTKLVLGLTGFARIPLILTAIQKGVNPLKVVGHAMLLAVSLAGACAGGAPAMPKIPQWGAASPSGKAILVVSSAALLIAGGALYDIEGWLEQNGFEFSHQETLDQAILVSKVFQYSVAIDALARMLVVSAAHPPTVLAVCRGMNMCALPAVRSWSHAWSLS
jgi:hypothetical protein